MNGAFRASLWFALLAGAFAPFARAFGGLVSLDAVQAFELYAAVCCVGYVALLARYGSGRAGWVAAAAFGAFVVGSAADSYGGLLVGLATILAVARASLYEGSIVRRAAIEIVLGCASIGFALAVGGRSPIGLAFATTSFYLVQSAFFLIGTRAERRGREACDDFEAARDRLVELLDRP